MQAKIKLEVLKVWLSLSAKKRR